MRFFFVFVVVVHAQEVLPTGCAAVVIKDDFVNIPAAKYSIIFFHSLAENDIWVVHQPQGEVLQSTWSSKINPGKWSALVLNKHSQAIKFSCIESTPGHEQRTSCREVLAICQWPHAKVPENKNGVHFVAESIDLSALTAFSERNGYALS